MEMMKNSIAKITSYVCLLTLMGACTSATQSGSKGQNWDKDEIKKEIQAKENQFAELYNSGEMRSIGYYADDAISFSQNKEPLVGKEAIVAYLKAGFDSSSKGNKLTFTTNEVFVSSDAGQVVETGNYKLVDSTDGLINTGNYMVLFEKRNGSYVCVRDMSASDKGDQ